MIPSGGKGPTHRGEEPQVLLLGKMLHNVERQNQRQARVVSREFVEHVRHPRIGAAFHGNRDLFCRDVDPGRAGKALGAEIGEQVAGAASDFEHGRVAGDLGDEWIHAAVAAFPVALQRRSL